MRIAEAPGVDLPARLMHINALPRVFVRRDLQSVAPGRERFVGQLLLRLAVDGGSPVFGGFMTT